MKKFIFIGLFLNIFFSYASENTGLWQKIGAFYSYFSKKTTKDTVTFKADDGKKIEFTMQFINESPVLLKKLTEMLNGAKDRTDTYITNIDIKELTDLKSYISSHDIPELKQASASAIKALMELVQKETIYSRLSTQSTAIPQYFQQFFKRREELTEEELAILRKPSVEELIVKRLVYYDLPQLEQTLTRYSTLNIFNKEDKIREQFWNLITLLRISLNLKFPTIAAAVAEYIARQYITNIEEPSWFNISILPSEAQIRYKHFSYIADFISPELKRSILENAVLQTKSLARFLKILSTLTLPQNALLLQKFTNFIMYSNLLESDKSLLPWQQELAMKTILKRRDENLKILGMFPDTIQAIRNLRINVDKAIAGNLP
jgi:hypothetical protein